MNKHDMTVTMPLKEFEALQKQIEKLKNQSIFGFIRDEYSYPLEKGPMHDAIIEVDKIKHFIRENDKYVIGIDLSK